MSLIDDTKAILADLIAFATVSADSNLELIAYCAARLDALGVKTDMTLDPSGRKANLFANYAIGDHNLRAVMRHIDSYDDERAPAARGNVGEKIDSQTTFDLFYNWSPEALGLDVGVGVVNVTDEDPPFAAFDVSYDPYTHNPFGRTWKISLTKRFGGSGN